MRKAIKQQKTAVQSTVSPTARSELVVLVRQQGPDAPVECHGSSPENSTKTENDRPKQHLLGHFSQLVFQDHEPVQQTSNNGEKIKSPVPTILPATNPGPMEVESPLIQPGFGPEYTGGNMPVPPSDQASMEANHLNSTTSRMLQGGDYGDVQMRSHFNADFVSPSTYDYSAFDEPLNWIPPSIYPSPYDAELEQDFSFILPSLSDPPQLGTDYGMALPLDPTAQLYQMPPNPVQEMSVTGAAPAALVAMEQSPASSASDGMISARLTNASTTTSDVRRKKRKVSFTADVFTKPREQKDGYAFPDPPMLSSPGDSHQYCSPTTHDTLSSIFRTLCGANALRDSFEGNSFPDVATFNACIGLYFDNFHQNYSFIHRPSFGFQSHWLAILAVAAIGSTFSKGQHALDLREAYQEFLRRAVQMYADGANDAALDVPLAQARILNLIGLVQSDRDQLRSMAPRYHADLSRWCLESGILQHPESGVRTDIAIIEDIDNRWQPWKDWVEVETLRRVGYMAWMLDCCLGYMANARPLCNLDDARTPMPCAETVWNAPSPETWAKEVQDVPPTPSLCAGLETLYNKKKVDPTYSELSQTLLIHALYLRTWEVGTHIKQPLSEWVPTGKARGFLNTPSKDNFWLPLYPLYANWRNSACDCLDVLQWQASSVVAKASGVEHPVVLHLHLARIILLTPFQEIQDLLFSLIGKVNSSTRASFYVHDGSYQPRNSAKLPQIRKITWRWLREDQHKARLAMVHAGSVFWYVRRYSATSFFEPVAVYLAALVLWTYGSYKSAALERDAAAAANHRPEGGPSGPDAGAAIQLSRIERKQDPVEFINKATAHAEENSDLTSPKDMASSTSNVAKQVPNPPSDGGVVAVSEQIPSTTSPPRSIDSDGDEGTSSSDEQPEFIHLDRPCDDEMIQHFVRNGHNMSGHMSNVGDICKTPQKVLIEGAKLLRTRLACWGVSREYHDILVKLAELRKAG
ncbi:hypothetical protein A1O1_00414 [Capronia coronata CBS 617.96]|uniref:Xylanolytic transcriptional activator regulatory domain-containing protein n=1 Tax=Capronia coronata CBS 617.96 TaxID=1182541 RepID=W9ZLA1_9EURO|nr:uncharacterized protein A1O1_00414 [Capronia coronata CBS 617.96]EXJ95294.1 hypothetical protein A1O1_00414 [Capronia coronata CBS 617.96]